MYIDVLERYLARVVLQYSMITFLTCRYCSRCLDRQHYDRQRYEISQKERGCITSDSSLEDRSSQATPMHEARITDTIADLVG